MKTKHTFLTLFVLSILSAAGLHAQTFAWAKQLGGSLDDNNKAIATDANGNIYTCGRFNVTADLDPGAGTHYLTAGSLGAMYVSKLNASGDFLWAKQIDGNPDGLNLAVGMNGSVYIAGYFSGVIDCDPGVGVYNLATTSIGGTCPANYDVFILKLSSEGNFMWAGQIGGSGDDFAGNIYHKAGGGIALGANDEIYVGGSVGRENIVNITTSPLVDFDPNTGSTYYSSVNAASFVINLDSLGTFDWVNTWAAGEETGGACSNFSSATCHAIAVDNAGNVYSTGKVGGWQAYVRKISNAGASLWTAGLSGGLSVSFDVAIDANGSVYTTGYFAGTSDFDPSSLKYELKSLGSSGNGPSQVPNPGLADAFVWKLSSTGAYQWARQLGGSELSIGRSIALDMNGNVYSTGYFTGTNVDFDPDRKKKALLSATGGEDAYISKLTSSGNFVWAGKIGGTQNERGYQVEVDASGNIYTTGTFEGTADFNPIGAAANLTSYGGADVFVQKMTQASLRMKGEFAADNSLLLFPNPAKENVRISSDDPITHIEITDLLGKRVHYYHSSIENENDVLIDLSGIETGVYLVTCRTRTNTTLQKLVVSK